MTFSKKDLELRDLVRLWNENSTNGRLNKNLDPKIAARATAGAFAKNRGLSFGQKTILDVIEILDPTSSCLELLRSALWVLRAVEAGRVF